MSNLLFQNPRELFREKGYEGIAAKLQIGGGYVPQAKVLQYFCNHLWYFTPLLIEGERGAGKTALPEAVAQAFNLKIFELNCNSATDHRDMLGDWNYPLQGFYSSELRAGGKSFQEIKEQIFTADLFDMGEVLEAFDYSFKNKKPCVLLLDEVDKLDERAEDFLLKILARGFHKVARMKPSAVIGFENSTHDEMFAAFPLVIATSNNMRTGLSSPFRSRFSCCFIKSPSQEEIIEILAARVPDLITEKFQPTFLQLVRFIDAVRQLTLAEKPALREFLNFSNRLINGRAPAYELTREVIDNNLDTLAKTEKDAAVFNARLDGLVTDSAMENKKLLAGTRIHGGDFFTAEILVAELLERHYQMATNVHNFVKIPTQNYNESFQ